MKKKLLAVLLVLCMVGIMGCQKDTTPQVEEEEVEETLESMAHIPQINISTCSMDAKIMDDEVWLVHASYQLPEISGEEYDNLATALSSWAEEKEAELAAHLEETAAEAEADEYFEAAEDSTDYYMYAIYSTLRIVRLDENFLCLEAYDYEYLGGVHGSYGYTYLIYDVQTGEKLALTDVLSDAEGFLTAAETYVLDYLSCTFEEEELFEDYVETVHSTLYGEPTWYMDAYGITFVFNIYEIAPYATGEICISLPFTEESSYVSFGSYVKDEYVNIEGTAIVRVEPNTLISWVLEGEARTLCVDCAVDSGNYEVRFALGTIDLSVGTFGNLPVSYLVRLASGSCYMIMDADYASDDYLTVVYEITDGAIALRNRLDDASIRYGVLNTDEVTLQVNVDVFGSYDATMTYNFEVTGGLKLTGSYYEIEPSNGIWSLLTVATELPVTLEGENTTLPVGTTLRIIGTDNSSIAYFRLEENGAEGTISFVRGDGAEDDYTLFIDGVSEDTYFSMLPYAG